VQTRGGSTCPLYPIDEFVPGQAPTSDAEGRMVFHHVGAALEFGGRESRNLLGMQFGETKAPQYDLVFSVVDKEVHRLPYDALRPQGEAVLLRITWEWQHPDWPLREYVAHQDEWSAHRHRLFDGNRDGKLDREERIAAGYVERFIDPSESSRRKRKVEFVVVERSITLSKPESFLGAGHRTGLRPPVEEGFGFPSRCPSVRLTPPRVNSDRCESGRKNL
jgi:hypothetical protein